MDKMKLRIESIEGCRHEATLFDTVYGWRAELSVVLEYGEEDIMLTDDRAQVLKILIKLAEAWEEEHNPKEEEHNGSSES